MKIRIAAVGLGLVGALGCQEIDRFDTGGSGAYCGSIVSAQFIRTTLDEGGFQRTLRLRLEIDADSLTTRPGTLTTDDASDGPCAPRPTFDRATIRATPEVLHDPLSNLLFGEEQEHNVLGWVDSTCEGPMFAVVSLLKNDDVELRLMKPASSVPPGTTGARDAFARFDLARRDDDCGF